MSTTKKPTKRRTRTAAPKLDPEQPFTSWAATGALTDTTAHQAEAIRDALVAWYHDAFVEPGGSANPLQAALLARSILKAVGIELLDAIDQIRQLAAAIEVEEQRAKRRVGFSESMEDLWSERRSRQLALKHARCYLALARGEDSEEVE